MLLLRILLTLFGDMAWCNTLVSTVWNLNYDEQLPNLKIKKWLKNLHEIFSLQSISKYTSVNICGICGCRIPNSCAEFQKCNCQSTLTSPPSCTPPPHQTPICTLFCHIYSLLPHWDPYLVCKICAESLQIPFFYYSRLKSHSKQSSTQETHYLK